MPRMLIAVPVLLLGQLLMESRFRMVVKHITDARLLDVTGLSRMDDAISKLQRLRDSGIPELVILLLLVVHTVTSFKGLVDATPWLAYAAGRDLHLTPAGWYAVLVSATMSSRSRPLEVAPVDAIRIQIVQTGSEAGPHASRRPRWTRIPRSDTGCLHPDFIRCRHCHRSDVASGASPRCEPGGL